jgi:hypothetical protein
VENGDLNWIIEGKFLAFAGPHNSRDLSPEGYYTLTPEDYGHYFVKNNVSLVVRLNKKYYDEQVRHSLVERRTRDWMANLSVVSFYACHDMAFHVT